jgi:hypothetical protein
MSGPASGRPDHFRFCNGEANAKHRITLTVSALAASCALALHLRAGGHAVRVGTRGLPQPGMVAGGSGLLLQHVAGFGRDGLCVFVNLELADRQELFKSDANSDRYGMITQAANPQTNPDGLRWGWPNGP